MLAIGWRPPSALEVQERPLWIVRCSESSEGAFDRALWSRDQLGASAIFVWQFFVWHISSCCIFFEKCLKDLRAFDVSCRLDLCTN